MATARVATGSVLGAVTALSTTVSSIFETTGDGVQMLHNYVNKHLQMQQLKTAVDLDSYENRLVEDTVKETITRRIELDKFVQNNPNYTEDFQKELSRVKALLNPAQNSSVSQLNAA